MYEKKPLFLVLLSCICLSSLFAAEPVEIYYFDKQRAYRVEGVEEGKPKLVEASGGDVSAYEGPRHDSWWVKGYLPMEAGWASSLSYYGTKRVASSYRDRNSPRKYSVWVMPMRIGRDEEENDLHTGALYVFGWVLDGQLTRYHVSGTTAESGFVGTVNFEISEKEFGGYPVSWLVEEGKVLEFEPDYWSQVFIGRGKLDIDELVAFRDERGRTALHYAASNGDRVLAEKLVQAEKRLIRVYDEDEISPLRCAAENGRTSVVEFLLEHKASVSDGRDNLTSVLRRAANNGHFETVKLLAPGKSRGAKMEWQYSWAATDALNANYEDIAMYLIELGAKFTVEKVNRGAFVLAKFESGYPELGFRLLDKFKLEPTVDVGGYNLLHSVASYADVPLLNKVGAMGVDLSQRTEKGRYPVDHAVGLGNVDAICWFLDNGGRYEVGKDGIDPLKYAIESKQIASVECLIGYGYDVNRLLGPTLTPLMYAAYLREFDIARLLAEAGGVFLLDSPHLDLVTLRIVAGDRADLIETLIGQGWLEDRLLLGSIPLEDAAEFYGSKAVLSELETRAWSPPSDHFFKVADLDQKPVVVGAAGVDYPLELQEKFGEQKIVSKIGIGANGVPLLVDVRLEPEFEELRKVVEDAVYSIRFQPAVKDGTDVPVTLQMLMPLKVEFDPGSVFDMADVSGKPSATTWATPIYPYEMQFSRATGRVVVEFVLLPDGSVRNAKVVKSDNEAFNRPALNCVEQTSWSPATKDGIPVACRVSIPIDFKP